MPFADIWKDPTEREKRRSKRGQDKVRADETRHIDMVKERHRLESKSREPWLKEMRECRAYYDNHQWEQATIDALDLKDKAALAVNRIAKKVDTVHGTEVYHRQKVVFVARDPNDPRAPKQADLATNGVEWALEQGKVIHERSTAWQDSLIGGVGSVGFRMDHERDPRGRLVGERIDMEELHWDHNARKQNLEDAAWISRNRMWTIEEIRAVFGEEKADRLVAGDRDPTRPSPGPGFQGDDEEHTQVENRDPNHSKEGAQVVTPGDPLDERNRNAFRVTEHQWWEREPCYIVVDDTGDIAKAQLDRPDDDLAAPDGAPPGGPLPSLHPDVPPPPIGGPMQPPPGGAMPPPMPPGMGAAMGGAMPPMSGGPGGPPPPDPNAPPPPAMPPAALAALSPGIPGATPPADPNAPPPGGPPDPNAPPPDPNAPPGGPDPNAPPAPPPGAPDPNAPPPDAGAPPPDDEPEPDVPKLLVLAPEEYAELVTRLEGIGQPEPDYVLSSRRRYMQSFHSGDVLLDKGPMWVNGFSYLFLTHKWDNKKKVWYGMIRNLLDPQKAANKFFSQGVDIWNSGAKGALVIETGAAASPKQLVETWAGPSPVVMMNDGGVSGGKFQVIPPPEFSPGAMTMTQFMLDGINDVGPSQSLDGSGQQVDASGAAIQTQQQQGMTTMGAQFDGLKRFRFDEALLVLTMLSKFVADGRWIRIAGKRKDPYVRLLRVNLGDPENFDLEIDEVPRDPNAKRAIWTEMGPLLPIAFRNGKVPDSWKRFSPLPDIAVNDWIDEDEQQASQPPPPDLKTNQQYIDAQIANEMANARLKDAQATLALARAQTLLKGTSMEIAKIAADISNEERQLQLEEKGAIHEHVRGATQDALGIMTAVKKNDAPGSPGVKVTP